MPATKRKGVNRVIARMLFGSDHQAIAWFELLLVSALCLLMWSYQATLSYEQATDYFYWPLLGPLIVALRYGFGRGMMCFLLLIFGIYFLNYLGVAHVPVSLSVLVGTAVVTMTVGEFRDHWHEVNQRYELNHRYMEQKIQSFTQNYHLLKVSHDQLEQRAAGKQMSLRTGIQLLQQDASPDPEQRVKSLADKSLKVFAEVITMYQAGLYEVHKNQIISEPMATIGTQHYLDESDPMLLDAIQSARVVTPANFIEHDNSKLHYQLVIPLVDVSGEVQGVVIAEKVKFVALNQSNIALVALLGGYIANFMSDQLFTPVLAAEQRVMFKKYVNNQLEYKRQYGNDSTLVVFIDRSQDQYIDLEHVTDFRRGADVYWSCQYQGEFSALCVLLPMTTLLESGQFIERITNLIKQKGLEDAKDLEALGPYLLDNHSNEVNALLEDLGAFDEDLVDTSNAPA